MATVRRLQQTLSHLEPPKGPQLLSIVEGPTQPELLDITLGELLTLQSLQYGDYECLVFPWTCARWTYADLKDEADWVARGLLAMGIQKSDRIGIMAGNCEQYISVFFAAALVGPFWCTYEQVIQRGLPLPSHALQDREAELHSADVCNLQFTSGSTGNLKAAMLTHQYIKN
ncbi:hypothetical protein CDV55_103971 [Aspergillus turcosus]|uniref:AMP-dependent synthetase/ligase domain-containing protein n=1 Tax=Aspergillus turcosus TaxID=1245748 RepID=A0A397H235_9EURO|nr:hypothetical protein CDV55_103971 [Aspergillus turcosus]RLL95275.1 hypothetical protein CFD26_104278 [Aspergillus turcosus]